MCGELNVEPALLVFLVFDIFFTDWRGADIALFDFSGVVGCGLATFNCDIGVNSLFAGKCNDGTLGFFGGETPPLIGLTDGTVISETCEITLESSISLSFSTGLGVFFFNFFSI